MTLTARQLYFEAVKVGDELPPLVKPPVDRLQIARYVGAAQDWNPLYIDEPHAKNSGFPSALAPGVIAMGFLGELVVDWVRGARLRKFSARFVKIVWPGDVLTARGRVVDRRFEEGGRYAIDVELWAENQRGELVVRGLATVQLFYGPEDEARQRAGQPPQVVTPAEEEARLAKLSRAQPARAVPPPRPMAPPRPMPGAQPARSPGPPAPAPAHPGAAAKPAQPRPAPAKSKPRPKPSRAKGSSKPSRSRPAKVGGKARPKKAAKRPASREKASRSRARAAKKPSGKKRR
ncbi:MAG TPA: MaoC/PaaZ C-terminal domain-containing protein [Anaeromyxobacteraceae bacterium]|nr:MaoC/PaaZ C-terminal domain-containing protein [Anaeromyxobacteraceae bacterium]